MTSPDLDVPDAQGTGQERERSPRVTIDLGPSRDWAPRVAVREGIRQATCGRWITTGILLFSVWASALLASADAAAVAKLVAGERDWIAAGGWAVAAENPAREGVPMPACERPRASSVVRSASALREHQPVGFTAAPEALVPAAEVTEGIWSLLHLPPRHEPSLILPRDQADKLGVGTGATLQVAAGPEAADVPGGPLRVVVADTSLLGESFSGTALVPVRESGLAEHCFIDLHRPVDDTLGAALGASLLTQGVPAVVSPLLISGDFTRDYSSDYAARPMRQGYLVVGAFLGILWGLVLWIRRGQDALYLTLGATRSTKALIRFSEWITIMVLAAPWALALAVVLGVARGAGPALAVTTAVTHVGATLLLATAIVGGFALFKPPSLLAALKDR